MQRKTHTTELPREDIRSLSVFTIDPDTAKDFDDALSIRRVAGTKDWYELGVHIADVTHYVTFDSAIDIRAQEKATSVYLVNECLPMLPANLSEDACSLVPNQDRDTFSVFFEINTRGEVRATRFAKTLIHSKHRFTYSSAQKVLDTKKGPLAEDLLLLAKITTHVRANRLKNGGIEFNNEEIQFIHNAQGVVVDITKKKILFTMNMIEECMLLANTAVAQELSRAVKKHTLPIGIYRVHNGPQGEKLQFLKTMLDSLRVPFPVRGDKVTASDLKKVLTHVHKTGVADCVQMVLLRSMGKAEYTTKNTGHFGLGFPCYTHFTSPIRRYADVMVHRLLTAHLLGVHMSKAECATYTKMCTHALEQEIHAQEAERDSIKQAQCHYLASRVGKKCIGHITGVMPFGIFVRDEDTLAEGFIHVRSLPEYLTHHEPTRTLRGKKTNYRLGDPIRFTITKVDTSLSRIDCELTR